MMMIIMMIIIIIIIIITIIMPKVTITYLISWPCNGLFSGMGIHGNYISSSMYIH